MSKRFLTAAVILLVSRDVDLAHGAEARKVAFSYSAVSMTWFPVKVALEKGFFRNEGIEPQLIQMNGISPRSRWPMAIRFFAQYFPCSQTLCSIDEHKRDSIPRLLVSSSVINPSHSAQAPRTNHSTRVRTSRDEAPLSFTIDLALI
jgi:hypothetical protein